MRDRVAWRRSGWSPWLALLWVGCAGPVKEPAPADDSHPPDTGPPITQVADEAEALNWMDQEYLLSGTAILSDDRSTLTGEVWFTYTIEDTYICDIRVSLAGTAVSGTCEDCEFTFDVEATVLEDNSTDGCRPHPSSTYIPTGYFKNPQLGFAYEYWYAGSSVVSPYYNVVLSGFSKDGSYFGYEGYYPGPYWDPIAADGHRGPVTYADHTLSWYVDFDDRYGLWANYQDCGDVVWSEATAPYGGTTVEGQVTCPINTTDAWTVDAEVGDTLWVTVDALDKDTVFQPWVIINRPDGCTEMVAYDNYVCSDAPGNLMTCASGEFTATQTGAYAIWIASTGFGCNLYGDVTYTLSVDRMRAVDAAPP